MQIESKIATPAAVRDKGADILIGHFATHLLYICFRLLEFALDVLYSTKSFNSMEWDGIKHCGGSQQN